MHQNLNVKMTSRERLEMRANINFVHNSVKHQQNAKFTPEDKREYVSEP